MSDMSFVLIKRVAEKEEEEKGTQQCSSAINPVYFSELVLC